MMVYFTGRLKITVIEAENLKATNYATRHSSLVGATRANLDPYIALDIDDVHFAKTKPKQKTVGPEYKEEFETDVHNGQVSTRVILLPSELVIQNFNIPPSEIYFKSNGPW